MQALKIILIAIYFIVALAVIVLTMMQSGDEDGVSSTIVGSSGNSNFYDKNKGNTKAGKQKKWTIILGLALVVLCLVLGTIYVL